LRSAALRFGEGLARLSDGLDKTWQIKIRSMVPSAKPILKISFSFLHSAGELRKAQDK